MKIINLNKSFNIHSVLTYKTHAKTSIILDCECETRELLLSASEGRFYNKTYSWILLDNDGTCQRNLKELELQYLGPNAQIIQVKQADTKYDFSDIHSKGRHLGAPLEKISIAKAFAINNSSKVSFTIFNSICKVQGINYRNNFKGLTLRAAAVVSIVNIILYIYFSVVGRQIGGSAKRFCRYSYLTLTSQSAQATKLIFNIKYSLFI